MSCERLKRKWYKPNSQHVTGDHEWDFDHFHGPLNRMQNTHVHGPGVVSGLEVDLAVRDGSGNVEVKIRPGTAIDRKGDLISLSPLGFAATGEAPGEAGRQRPQKVDVSPTGEGDSKSFAIKDQVDDWPAFVTMQFHWRKRTSDDGVDPRGASKDLQPWLRIQTEATLREDTYNQDHPPVLLAQLVKNEQTGNATLLSGDRQLISTSLGALAIRRPIDGSGSVGDAFSATIGPGDDGGLCITVPNKDDELLLKPGSGEAFSIVNRPFCNGHSQGSYLQFDSMGSQGHYRYFTLITYYGGATVKPKACWDYETGAFTAPEDGFYFCCFSICVEYGPLHSHGEEEQEVFVWFRKNEEEIPLDFVPSRDRYAHLPRGKRKDQASATLARIIQLAKDDKIRTYICTVHLQPMSLKKCEFSAFLISK